MHLNGWSAEVVGAGGVAGGRLYVRPSGWLCRCLREGHYYALHAVMIDFQGLQFVQLIVTPMNTGRWSASASHRAHIGTAAHRLQRRAGIGSTCTKSRSRWCHLCFTKVKRICRYFTLIGTKMLWLSFRPCLHVTFLTRFYERHFWSFLHFVTSYVNNTKRMQSTNF